MSKTIDQKVVQMQFDNAQFEQNAKQSMSTLDKLKAALKFDGANKGVEDLNKSIKGLDFSQAEVMATKAGFHIQDVFLKISNVLEYNIARRIIHIGENIAKSLTLDQITAGFNEYQLKMDSVQTIMSSTGEKIEVVNGYLEELNHYSDKTIYSFSDMTQNIGKFTNAGVKLKDAVAAIQGVANVAAVSGANANEASRAMYNFAQALSSGFVKLIDWKSIENANMATVEFKETLLETATALNYCEKSGDGMYKVLTKNAQGKTMDQAISATKNFNDSLAYQWMKTDVLTQALEIYSKDVRDMTDAEVEAYEAELRRAGFTDQQIIKFEELGIKATDAATKVRTFKQLIDAVKEAIGSGWAMSFEHIIGNLEEAKELLTKINNVVSGIVDKISTRRNTLLSNWKDRGGRESLIKSFENIAKAIGKVIEVAKQLWYDLFPPTTSKNLYLATKRFEIFTRSLIMNKETATKLRETLHYLLIPVKVLIVLLKTAFALIVPTINVLQPLLRITLNFTSALVKAVLIIAKAVYQSQAFQRVLSAIKTTITTVWSAIKSFVTTIGGELVKAFQDSNSWLWKFINGLVFLGKISLGAIVSVFNTIANFKFSDVANGIDKMRVRIKEFVDGLRESAKESKALQVLVTVIDKLKSAFEFLKEAFLAFGTTFSEGLEKVESFSDLLKLIKDSAENAFAPIINFFKDKFLGENGNVFENLKNSFLSFIDALKEGAKNIPWAKVLLIAFCLGLAAAVLQLVNAISKFSILASALSESIRIVNETVKTFTGVRNRLRELKEIAIFIGTITLSIATLSLIPKEDLTRAAIALGAVAGGLMVLAEVMMIINKKSILKPGATSQLLVSLAGLAAGAAILTAAIIALSDLKKTISDLLPYIAELGVVMLELIAAMTILAIIGKKLTFSMSAFSALSLVAFAGSVYLLCAALKSLQDIEFNKVDDLVKVLLSVLGGFAAITALTKKLGFWSFASLIAIMVGLKNLAPTIKELATIELTDDVKRILELVAQIVTVVGVVSVVTTICSSIVKILRPKKAIMGRASSLLGDFSRTLLAIGISMSIMTLAITHLINSIDKLENPGRVKMALVAAAAIVAGLGIFIVKVSQGGKIFNTHKGGILKFAAAMALMSLTIVPLVLCVEEISKFIDKNNGAYGSVITAGIVVGGLIALLGVFVAFSSKAVGVDFKVILATFGSLTLIIAEMGALAILIETKNGIGNGLVAALGLLTAVLIELDGALLWLSKMKFDAVNVGAIIAFTSSITILFGGMIVAAALLDKNDMERLANLMVDFLLMTITLAGSLWVLSKAANRIEWAPILAFAALIGSFAASFIFVSREISSVDWPSMEKVFNSFVGVVAILAGIGWVLSKSGASGDTALTIIALATGVVALAGAMKLLEGLDIDFISEALLDFVTALGVLATIAAIIGGLDYLYGIGAAIQIAMVAMAGLAAAVGVLSAGLGVLAWGASQLAIAFDEHLVPALITLGENADTVVIGIKALADAIGYAIKRIAVDISRGMVTISTVVSTEISNIARSISTAIELIITTTAIQISAGIDLIWDTIVSKLTGKEPEYKKKGEDSGKAFKDGLLSTDSLVVNAALSIISELLGTFGGAIGDLFVMGANLAGSLLSGFKSKNADGYIENQIESKKYGSSSGGLITGKTQTLYKKQAKEEGNIAARERQKYFKNFNEDLDRTFLPKVKATNKEVANNSKSTWDKVKSLVTDAKNSSVMDFKILGRTGSEWVDTLGGYVTKGIDEIKAFTDPSTWSGDFLNYEDVMKQIKDAQDEAADSAKGVGAGFEAAGDGAKKGAKGVKEAKDEISSFVEKMEGSFNILDEFDLGLDEENPLSAEKLLQNMQSNIDGMTTWSSEMVGLAGKMSEGLYKKLADMGPQGYKYVHAFAQMTEEQLMQVNQLYAQSLIIPTSVTQQIYTGMAQAGMNAYTGFINGLNIPAMQESGINMAAMLMSGISGPQGLDIGTQSKATYDKGTKATKGLGNGVADPAATKEATDKSEGLAKSVTSAVEKEVSPEKYYDIGKNAVTGLTNGINDAKARGDLGSAIKGMCSNIISTTKSKDGLWENSPSKIFRQIGQFVSEGLALGITDKVGVVEDSVSKMTKTTIDNMRDAVSTIQTAIDSDMDVEPVIRPVVDLSNIQNGANSINSLMGMNFGSNVTMPAASFMQTSQLISNTDNTNVVSAINSLSEDVTNLKDAMTNIKMVLDTGAMVGAMTPSIDNQLGRNRMYAGRGI